MRATVWLSVALALVMSASVLPNTIPSILGSFLLEDLGLSRASIGVLISTFTGVGAVASPALGRITDRFGGRAVVLFIVAVCAVSIVVTAAAPVYAVMLVGAIIAGSGGAAGNPATNAIVMARAPVGSRGLLVGVKQSGVQIAYVISGVLLPFVAARAGWRAAALSLLVVPALGLLLVSRTIPRVALPPLSAFDRAGAGPLHPDIRRLSVYAFLMGTSTAAVMSFLPLYAYEAVGLSQVRAGVAVVVVSATGVVSRIWLGSRVERLGNYGVTLLAISAASVVSVGLLALAATTSAVFLYAGAALAGGSLIAWNAVGMLAVMAETPQAQVGRASGAVLLGFLGGMAASPPLIGWSVDVTGSYLLAWGAVAIALALAGAVIPRELMARQDG